MIWLNYLKTAFRNLSRNKGYTFVNIFGLALGLFCSVFLSFYVLHETTFDRFHENKDRLYRINSSITQIDSLTTGMTSFGVGPTLKQEFSEIKQFTRLVHFNRNFTLGYEDEFFRESSFFYTDSTFFQMFSFKLKNGDKNNILNKPFTVVLTESLANKVFNKTSPIGKKIRLNTQYYEVVGIAYDPPKNSDIQFNGLISVNSISQNGRTELQNDWFWISAFTYVLTNNKLSNETWNRYFEIIREKYLEQFYNDHQLQGKISYSAQPITQLHLDSSKQFDSPKGSKTMVWIFITVALLIILIACINYINLTLAQSMGRAKEIGIRKTLGASNSDIALQFLSETLILTAISFLIALVFIELWLPSFNQFTGLNMSMDSFLTGQSVLLVLAILLLVSLVGGAYPAFYLSKLNPTTILRGVLVQKRSTFTLRKILITLQFGFSMAMIISSIVVYKQLQFFTEKDLGYNKDQVLVIEIPGDTTLIKNIDTYKNNLLQSKNVLGVSMAQNIPVNGTIGELIFRVQSNNQFKERAAKFITVDDNYLPLLNINIEHGRNFNKEIANEKQQAFIINKSAAKAFGWDDNPIGKKIQWGLLPNNEATNDGYVVGLVNDFNYHSLHNPIEPLVILFEPKGGRFLHLKVSPNFKNNDLEKMEEDWKRFCQNHPFIYYFLNDEVSKQYASENKMMKLFSFFSLISILIAMLGLFALTSFMVKQKTKELGIRKILGASTISLNRLISKEFIILLVIAFLVSSPVAFYFLTKWLNSMAYHINLNPILFLVSGLITGVLSWFTIWIQNSRIANSNPINALRME